MMKFDFVIVLKEGYDKNSVISDVNDTGGVVKMEFWEMGIIVVHASNEEAKELSKNKSFLSVERDRGMEAI